MDNGSVNPAEVLEGSTVTVTCNEGFELEGSNILECQNGRLQDSSGAGLATCVQINQGLTQCWSLTRNLHNFRNVIICTYYFHNTQYCMYRIFINFKISKLY